MQRFHCLAPALLAMATLRCPVLAQAPSSAQVPSSAQAGPTVALDANGAAANAGAPLPDPASLLKEVERNEERLETLRNDYTYHVHMEQKRLRKDGSVKQNDITDAESLTLKGVRVDRIVARDGKPLTTEQQAKESERLDKEVAKANERRAKASAAGQSTDSRGDTIVTVARILELGSFSDERRVNYAGRPTIVLAYTGDPKARTRSNVENVVKDLVGTIWIDEADHVLIRGEGHFLNDFKVGGGLLADVRKGSNFDFEARRINDAVWLPATINGRGSVRILLFAGFDGEMHLTASDYRRFRTSATIVSGPSVVQDPGANPVPEKQADPTKSPQ